LAAQAVVPNSVTTLTILARIGGRLVTFWCVRLTISLDASASMSSAVRRTSFPICARSPLPRTFPKARGASRRASIANAGRHPGFATHDSRVSDCPEQIVTGRLVQRADAARYSLSGDEMRKLTPIEPDPSSHPENG